jgi:transcriptional regulator with XRE-family HTH domain
MSGKASVIEIEISSLDWYIINQVKKLRGDKEMSQDALSVAMGFSEKFVGNVENPSSIKKYNIKHLNLIAKTLNCTLRELLPEKPFEHDMIKVKIKRSPLITKTGKKSKKMNIEIVDIKPVKG